MKRIKLLLPSGDHKHAGMIAHCKVVDADTGEPIECVRTVRLHVPFEDAKPGVVTADVELLVAEIQTVPAERAEEVFGQYARFEPVGSRPRGDHTT